MDISDTFYIYTVAMVIKGEFIAGMVSQAIEKNEQNKKRFSLSKKDNFFHLKFRVKLKLTTKQSENEKMVSDRITSITKGVLSNHFNMGHQIFSLRENLSYKLHEIKEIPITPPAERLPYKDD